MGFEQAFMDELAKIAQVPPAAAAKSPGILKKIWEWMKKNPGKSGFAGGWLARGVLGGGDRE
jgi:hypothetical protein